MLVKTGPQYREVLRLFTGGGFALGGRFLPNTANVLCSLLLALLMLAACHSVGLRLLGFLAPGERRTPARFTAVLLGYCTISTALLGAAALGLWYAPILVVMTFAAIPADARRYLKMMAGLAARRWGGEGGAALAWTAFPVVVIAVGMVCLTPETHSDCMAYHLAFPQQVLQSHRLFGGDMPTVWDFPHAADFPNVIPLLFGVDTAAKIMRPALIVIGMLGVFSAMGARAGAPLAAAIMAVALLTPGARHLMLVAKSDGVVLAVFCAITGVLVEYGSAGQGRRMALALIAGILGGFAAASKYTVIPSVAIIPVMLATRPKGGICLAMALAGGAGPVGGWAARSFLYTGDPFYPAFIVFAPWLIGNPAWHEQAAIAYAWFAENWGQWGSVAKGIGKATLVLASDGFVAIACFLVVGRGTVGMTRVVVGMTAVLFASVTVIQAVFPVDSRFLQPITTPLNLIGMLLAVGCQVTGGWRRLGSGAIALLAVACSYALLADRVTDSSWRGGRESPGLFFRGLESVREYRDLSMGAYGPVLERIREKALEKERGGILAINPLYGWGIPLRLRGEGLAPPFLWKAFRGCGSMDRALIRFKQARISLVIYSPTLPDWARSAGFTYEWSPGMARLYARLAARHLRMDLFAVGFPPPFSSMCLYELDLKSSVGRSTMLFLPGAEGVAWRMTETANRGDYEGALALNRMLRGLVPGVIWVDMMKLDILERAGRKGEAGSVRQRLEAMDATRIHPGVRMVVGPGRQVP